MSFVELHIDEDNCKFLIFGDISQIIQNRRARYYFLDVLHAEINDTSVAINYIEEDKEIILQEIQHTLIEYGIEQRDSEKIKDVLRDFYQEKENFEIFGRKAKGIWNNELSLVELQEFKQTLETHLIRGLYDKQLLASFHLAFSQNACNFSVPGSGKTSIVYAAYSYLNGLPVDHPKYVNKLLVVGPLSSFGPWEDEFFQCFGKWPGSIRLSGGISKEDRDRHLLSIKPIEETPELTLMSYQSVPNNIPSLLYYLQRRGNKVMVVLDEAHRIKNVDDGVWAQSILDIAKYCKSRVVLTGTPLPNGYEDMYNLFEFIWPGKEVIGYSVSQLKDMSKNRFDSRVNQLIENVSPYFVRIRKSHLKDLPSAIDHKPNYVDMGETQREIYDFIEKKYLSYFIGNETSLSVSTELTKARFIRLMQAATNPNLLKTPLETFFKQQGLGDELYIDDSEIVRKILKFPEYEEVPQKFSVIKDLVDKLLAQNEKVVIWTTFIQNTKELQDYLNQFGIASRLLIGEVPVERDDIPMEDVMTREKIIREFHDPNSSFKVIIANPFAVAESISLHKACHQAIYLERTFNATHFIQSKDRIHRVGLESEAHYYYILSRNSIDETIHQRLQEKEQRMLEIIENEEIPLFSENMDYEIDLNNDIKAIIRDYVRRTTKA